MSAEKTIKGYFEMLKQKKAWDSFLAEDMNFTSYVVPVRKVSGKSAYIDSTRRFYSMIVDFEIRDMIIEGSKACVLTSYELHPPQGNNFKSDVAEIFTVKEGKIDSLSIYFDTSPFPK